MSTWEVGDVVVIVLSQVNGFELAYTMTVIAIEGRMAWAEIGEGSIRCAFDTETQAIPYVKFPTWEGTAYTEKEYAEHTTQRDQDIMNSRRRSAQCLIEHSGSQGNPE